jgi:hypothetical protein
VGVIKMNETSGVKVSLVTLSFQRKVVNMKKIKPVLVILGLSVLLFAAVLTMTSGVANAGLATATRTLPEGPVPAGECFTVVIEVSGYGDKGRVDETLPEGFCYMTSSLNPVWVTVEVKTNTVTFPFGIGITSFTYTVQAPDTEGAYPTISGILKDEDKDEYVVSGDTEIVVEEAEDGDAEPTATRTLPEETIAVGECFTIEIEATGYGIMGHVVETLLEGFVYENSTLSPERVEVEDNTVEFTLRSEPSFTYTVTAPDTEGTYTVSGILRGENEYDIDGDTEIEVGEKSVEVSLPANITAWNPIEVIVNNTEGESRTFNITVNQTVNISWQINGTEVQTNESVTEAVYTNTSAVAGIWNVSAIATNTTIGVSDMHTWTWSVTLTPTITPTPTVNITSTPTPTPSVTPTPTSKPSITPTPVSTPTPSPPGFETGLAFVAIFAVAYLLLFRKKKW